MSAKTFVDTNVLIYAHDVEAGAKHEIANHRLRELWTQRAGALSTQVLQEFYVNVTRKSQYRCPKKPLAGSSIAISCGVLIRLRPKLPQLSASTTRPLWDALIVAAALKTGAGEILSEDLNANQTITGVRINNPFAGNR